MYTFKHSATEQTDALTDYRYIGDSPNNYVKFNCDNDGENSETWRIVGVFSVDDGTGKFEQRIKLVRGELLDEKMAWNSTGSNEWSEASLNTYLNGTYFDSLSTTTQLMIGDAKYYLGGGTWNYDTSSYGSTEDMYAWERGTEVFNPSTDESFCNKTVTEGGVCAIRTTKWIGKVALLYPSDYGYVYSKGVDNRCYDNPYYCDESIPTKGWLYNSNVKGNNNPVPIWFLSPIVETSYIFLVYSGRLVYGYDDADLLFDVRPVVYLTSDVKIISGTGKENDPYILSK